MKELRQLLDDLSRLQVKLWADGDQLRLRAPKGVLTTDLKQEIKERKAELLLFLRGEVQQVERPPIEVMPRGETLPLSYAQQRLWFLEQLEGPSPTYNIPLAYQFTGSLQVTALEQAINEITRRHEVLRTTFPTTLGQPVQRIESHFTLPLAIVDLQHRTSAEQSAELDHLLVEAADQPFNLAEGPLVRVTLYRCSESEHLLLLNMHHIITDGWSMEVWWRELDTLYRAFAAGKPSPLPELALQYADFAQWQRQWLQGEVLQKQLAYWQQQLEDAPTLLELPTDHPRPAIQTFAGQTESIEIRPHLAERLRTLSHRTDTTLFMTLFGAFAVLLSRYSRQQDIVIGTSIANRHYKEIEPLIGFFVNTLALRTDLSGNPTFEELLKRVREVTLDAYSHQDIPFERLVGELVDERHLSHTPLFQVMFEMHNVSSPVALADLHVSEREIKNVSAKFDLMLMFFDGQADGKLTGILEYNSDLFLEATIKRMIGHYLRLLEGIAENAQQPINQLPLLTEAETHQLLVEWNDTYVPCPTDTCFHQLFEAQVERTPDAPVLNRSNDFSRPDPRTTEVVTTYLSYRELNERANQLAHHLRALGVKPEVVVGVCMERCPETVISLLAIFKAGGVYIPLDPALPQERLSYMLTNSEAKVVLTKSQYAAPPQSPPILGGRLGVLGSDHNAQTVCLDTDWSLIAKQPTHNPLNLSTPQNLAYVIYTSGSTGLPKGAMIEHQGMVNHLYTKIIDLKMSASDRLAETAPQSFDISIWQFLSALLVGGTVHIFDDETVRNPALMLARTEAEKITILEVVPSLFRFMLDEVATLGVNRPEFYALRWLLLTGEALPPHLCREWLAYYPHIPLMNAYGPTECSDDVTHHAIYEPPPPNAVTVPIGRAVPNMRLYILDSYMQPVPQGVPGELYVGGIGVGRGYLNDPERTAKAFMDDPFAPGPEARFYKTGDLVRYRPDGTIEFLGRLDHQVKIRGHRIELGEIEGVLSKHPAVRQSLVIAQENGPADYSLVAYVAASPAPALVAQPARLSAPAPSVTELRHYLSQTLPDYMIPAAFVTLDAFPLTPNGKVDRKALPVPDVTPEQDSYLRPQTQSEEVLANIWAEVLGVERVGREENFFELGGHSLLAIQVISRLRNVFQVELLVRTVFEAPTIAKLALALERARQATHSLPVPPPILRHASVATLGRETEALLPLSFAQQRLWFLDQLEGPSATYNIPAAFRLKPSLRRRGGEGARGRGGDRVLQVDALEEALNQLIQRHEVLRTTFPTINGQPMQRIHRELKHPLTVIDLRISAGASPKACPDGGGVRRGGRGVRAAELERLLIEDVERPFDLAQGPLLRAHLYLLSESGTGNTEQVLQLTIHHIISDDWSMDVLIRELSALYQGEDLPPLPVQYADFAQWQREWLRGEVLERQLAYWRQQLADVPTLLDLPTDHPRPQVQTFNGQIERFELDGELTAQLASLSRRLGTSSFMTYYAAFAVLMARYSGQEDLVIGTPIANRQYREIEPLIGFFLNTLALRTDLSGNPSFADLMAQVRKLTLDAYAHQDIPFEQLVEELAVERNLSHAPLFQVMFVWLDESPPMKLGNMMIERLFLPTVAAKFDLTLFLGEESRGDKAPNGLWGMIEYNTDLFERATIERMIGHFKQLLTAIALDSAQLVNQLPLLTESERQQLLLTWNATESAYPMDKCLHQLFEEQAERTPNAVAVTFGEQQLTYRQLNQAANQLAHHLQAHAVGPDIVVGLCLERTSLEMIVGVLAILKAGGAYVPLDPAYPQERLTFMQRDAQIKVLLTHSERAITATEGTQTLYLDEIREQLALMPTSNPHSRVSPENLLYVIYTSGSTGRPKGVAMPHRSLINLVWWQQAQSQVSIEQRTLQFSAISFDASCQEIFSTLAFGGTLVLVDDETRRDGEALHNYLNAHRIERLFLPFVALQQLAQHAQLAPPTTLREVMTAGEQLQITEAIRRWFKQADCTLYNLYGPTESHVVTAYTLPEAVDEWSTLPPIGRPIANAQTYILDPSGQPVPIGVVGELYLGGHPLARGYLHRPELTEERFITRSIMPKGRVRLYKTGDLARYLPDGNIEFLGRADHQVKIRGFRVELGEIEARLSQYPAVQEAAVVAREDDGGVKRLVAYVVSREQAVISDVSALRAHLKAHLPEYMVPAAFVMLDALPLTPSGKINRRALPAPERENFVTLSEAKRLAPRTPTEEVLAAIWAEVLRVEQVGREDNFFDLGGHSLLATQIISRLREAFQLSVPVRTIFEAPTIADLAEAISSARQASQQLPVPPPIEAIERIGDLPLSFAQQRLWFLNQMIGPNPTYSLPMVLRLRGSLQVSALEQALGEIVRRHEILRTTFPTVEGRPVQRINPPQPLSLPVVSLQHSRGVKQTTELNRLLAEEALRSFDLAQGPLLRVGLYVLSDQIGSGGDYALFLNMHHIIADGWSMGILWQELDSLYQAFAASQPSPLPELSVQYADFAHWQRQWLQGEVLEKQLTYWQQQLANAPTLLELPTDRPRKAVQTFNGQVEPFEISPQLAEKLRTLSHRSGTSLFMTLYGAFSVLLGRLCRTDNLVIGTPIANRNYQEIEPLIGFFVNMLPLRIDLSGNTQGAGSPSFLELLARVRQVTLDAYAHQDIPFEQLLDELAVERQLSHTPLFQVVLMWQNIPRHGSVALTPTGLGDLTASLAEVGTVTAKFDLTLALGENEQENEQDDDQGGALWGAIEYNTDLFSQSTIQRFIGHFKQLLAGIVADPTQPINQLPILTPAERQQLLVEWNQTQTTYPTDKSIIQLFEEQVARTPQAVAVVAGYAQLTYHELNQRANQLAHYLIKMGVGAEVLVGICVERSLDMVVGLLAILKAGGAYLPLDPTYPLERLAFMIQDADVAVLLTQEHLRKTLANLGEAGASRPLTVVCLDSDWSMIANHDHNNLTRHACVAPQVKAENLAYVLYTSGSTGQPKGVMIEHRQVLAMLSAYEQLAPLHGELCGTSVCSYNFDVSVWEFFSMLCFGGTLHILTIEIYGNAERMVNYLSTHAINSAYLPPMLLTEIALTYEKTHQPLTLKRILVGVEPIPQKVLQRFRDLSRKIAIINGYGPTECTICSSFYEFNHAIEPERRTPIGKPLANYQIYLCDANLQPVPIGVSGEILIGGAGVGRSYLNRPELTEEKFIVNPFGAGRLYKTGDLARWLPDTQRAGSGNIEFLGRIDHQVKLRGFRIELGEIEAVLSQHPAVQATLVMVREETQSSKQLVAYVVPEGEIEPLIPELRAHLKQTLPDYMVPATFVLLENLPLTPNGKVDRRALPAPDQMQATEHYVSPQSDLEKAIANVWQEVLGLPRVSIHDNFFEVGGHSLLAVQIQSKLQATLEQEITITDLFTYATIASLAEYLSNQPSGDQSLAQEETIAHREPTQAELSLWEANQSRSQARRAALKERVTRQPRRRKRERI